MQQYNIKFWIVILFGTLWLSACDEKWKCVRNWTFEVPLEVLNYQDTYQVGDTIWIRSRFSNQYTDISTGDVVTMEKFPFITFFILNKIDVRPFAYANEQIEIVQKEGEIWFFSFPSENIPGLSGTHEFEFTQADDMNNLYFGMKIKEQGLYCISFFSYEGSRELTKANFSKNCQDYISPFHFRMEIDHEKNYELFQTTPDTIMSTIIFDKFVQNGFFTFHVTE